MINFNKIYVIQSLNEQEDELTGTQLYDEILQYFKDRYPEKDAQLINVDNRNQFFSALDHIRSECINQDVKPIIHFEIHGMENAKGFDLNDGQVEWSEIYEKLIEINEASSWNLLLTMAVCYGLFSMILMKPTGKAPFSGVLGSFNEIYDKDLYIRYNAFYQALLNGLSVEDSLLDLTTANSELPNDFKLIDAEQTFKKVYQHYLNTEFTDQKIRSRFIVGLNANGISSDDPQANEHNFNLFRTELLASRQNKFEKHKATFFMYDQFPNHRNTLCVNWQPVF